MHPRFVARSRTWGLVVALGLALALGVGLAASSCGPQQKFCPDSGDGVCRPPQEASPIDNAEPPMEAGCPNGTSVLADGAVVCNP